MKNLASAASTGAIAAIAGIFAVAVLAVPSVTQAGKPWKSIAADFDFTNECLTTAAATTDPAAPGGVSCFNKSVFVPGSANVLRITWSTAGDTHSGAALQVGCVITPASTGVPSFCNPLGTGAAPGFYITKNKLPAGTGATNCNDGGGGDGDCHDNSINQIWCVPVDGNDVYNIDLRIASNPGGVGNTVFVEASTFFIDGTKIKGDNSCVQREASAKRKKSKKRRR